MGEKRKYWYLFIYTACPLCGRGKIWKERKYSKKPKYPDQRHISKQVYDYCEQF